LHVILFKKNQKEFLRLAFNLGQKESLETITKWRSSLFRDSLSNLLKDF